MADDGTSVRVPRGILKNKYGSNSHDPVGMGRDAEQIAMHSSTMTYGVARGWDPQMPVAPVPAPQHGMNMPNPVLDPVMRGIKSEFPVVQQKLHEFINGKRDLLFRPLDRDETPLSESKTAQRNTEDHYGIVPSLDHFLNISSAEIKRFFFQNVQRGDILIGRVISQSSSGLYLKLVCTEVGKQLILEDLNLRTFCSAAHIIPADPKDPTRYYETDDYIRVEVVEVKPESDRLTTGMKGCTLSPELQHSFQLGLVSKNDLPRYYMLSGSRSSNPRTYHDILIESPGFQNPTSVSHLASNMGIYSNSNSLMKGIRNGYHPKEMASHLRRMQNAKWAHSHVAEGIKHFKQAKFTEAFQCLNSALNIDPENCEGLVARGALYANNGAYEKAIVDFESALKFNPNHGNARKYLAETLVAFGKQQENQSKLEDAIASYSKSLVIQPDHKETKEALWSLHARTEKLDPSKMSGPAAAKAAELKSKLKTILQNELGLKMEQEKSSKGKKSKKDKKRDSSASDDDTSSSSSSDDSSSDSSSSESGYKKKSKKRKKKKSKKSKKSRKTSESDKKSRELSLSPFSKKLAVPHGGGGGIGTVSSFSGFTDSTFAELQLGMSKPEKDNDTDNESKRSSKKSKGKKRSKKSKDRKKKKKRGGSSDSSSSESEGDKRKKKAKNQTVDDVPLGGIIPDLGDLEAKLSAYYSKIEQGKIETKMPSRRSRSRSRGRPRPRSKSRSISPALRKRPRDFNDIPPRVVENHPPPRVQEPMIEKSWSESRSGKIDLRTDDYGNMNMVQPQAIVCTVKNDAASIPPEHSKPSGRFEMKFKPVVSSTGEPENGTAPPPAADPTSKWRPLGAAIPQSEAVKNAFDRAPSPSEDDRRGYRRRSQTPSKSPARRGRRRSRSFSRSRSRSVKSRSRSMSRSRSRSRSPYRRDRYNRRERDGNYRGRPSVRFFRGYNYGSRGSRRPFNPRPYSNRDRDRDFAGRSRFRNRFSHTPSRSRSKSRSRSRSMSPSRDRRRDERSHDRVRRTSPREIPSHSDTSYSQTQETIGTSKAEADSASQSQEELKSSAGEIQIGSLKATSTADVEFLLDKRNAEKKEEMRKSNPDFFRAT